VPRGPRTQQEYTYPGDVSSFPVLSSAPLIVPQQPEQYRFPMLFSSKTSKTSQSRSADAARPIRRCSTTISMLEEEFGMREPPKATTRFGLPPKLRIIPPKRKQSTTQAPEPRRSSSFSKGPWETLWGCDLESLESPVEGIDFPSGIFPDHHAEQGSEFDHDVSTPTNGAPSWSSNEELTPLLSSNFPSNSNASRREDRPIESSGNRFLKP